MNNPPVANSCPQCKETYRKICKCGRGCKQCGNGHEWTFCLQHQQVIQNWKHDQIFCPCLPIDPVPKLYAQDSFPQPINDVWEIVCDHPSFTCKK